MALDGDTGQLVGRLAVTGDHLAHIDVLDRMMVRPEAERTPDAGEIRRLQRRPESIGIRGPGGIQPKAVAVPGPSSTCSRAKAVISAPASTICAATASGSTPAPEIIAR